MYSEPFGSILQSGSPAPATAVAAAAAAAAPAPLPLPADPPASSRSGVALSMRHNSMPHAEPWFHGRISRQQVSSNDCCPCCSAV